MNPIRPYLACLMLVVPIILLLTAMCVGGCSTARIHESYERGLPDAPATGAAPMAGDQRTVTQTVSATRVMSLAGTSPGETITHVKPLKVTGDGADFGGMEPVEPPARGPVLLITAGVLCALAGGAVLMFVSGGRKIGLGVIGLGAAFIVAGMAFEAYPWAALVLLGLAGVGAAVWLYLSTRNSARTEQALQIVAAGIEQTPDNEAVKENISNAAATRDAKQVVKDVITQIKKTL